jgi:hypothetical protein
MNMALSGQAPQSGSSPDASHVASGAVSAIDPAQVTTQSAQDRAQTLHDVMRLAIRLQEEKRFLAMAMAMCNELALRFACERVSLGWVDRHDLKLTAVSHVEHFDPKSQATRSLEAVMDEALAQESVLVYPPEPGTDPVLRAHQAYCEKVGATCITTVPLLHAETVMAVLCLERQAGTLTAAQLWELQLIADAVARWQHTLHDQDRWFGARWWAALNRQAGQIFKPSHTALKLTALTVSVLMALLSLMSWPYRVDATLAIRSQDLLFMPAPFDGYLRKVNVHVGEQVAERFPSFAEAGLASSWTGVYDVTPDWNPVLGAVPDVPGLVVGFGFSGHGFKLSPAVGRVLAQQALGLPTDVPLAPYALERFRTGQLLHGRYGSGAVA